MSESHEMETDFGGVASGGRMRRRQESHDGMTEAIIKNDVRRRPMNFNEYATRKTVAKGMMDVALLTANASQMKVCIQLGPERQSMYHALIVLLSLSMVLQLVVAILLLIVGNTNISLTGSDAMTAKQLKARKISDAATAVVFIVTFLNVVISSLGISERINLDNDNLGKN